MSQKYIFAEDLPSYKVFSEARDYLQAFLLVEKQAASGLSDLYWPAATLAGIACELYLKSFLVKTDPLAPGCLKRVRGHHLRTLYDAISDKYRATLLLVSQEVDPDFPLEKRIDECSNLFFDGRYSYESTATNILRSEVFELAPHLDAVIHRMG